MTPVLVWSIGIAIVLLVVVLIVVTRRRDRERTEALKQIAETAGLAFQAVAEFSVVHAIGDVPLYDRGHSKRVKNLMTGRLGERDVAVFDYQYTTGSGKNQNTSRQTVLVLPSRGTAVPDLQMAPENPLVDKIGQVFGYQDIDFDSNPEFSRRYLVRGPDEAAIRAALYPRALSYFAAHEGWTVEVRSGNVAIYRAARRTKPEEMRPFIEEAREAARNL